MEESERTATCTNTTSHLMDEVFTRVADLQDVFDVLQLTQDIIMSV